MTGVNLPEPSTPRAPGWYTDPIAADLERWWDGENWSETEFRLVGRNASRHEASLGPLEALLTGRWRDKVRSMLGEVAISVGMPAVAAALQGAPDSSAEGYSRTILRIDDVVQRPAGEWTPAVHLLLETLHESGLEQVPEPIEIDDGFELVSYLEGENLADAEPSVLWSELTLTDAAALLRSIHDRSIALVDADLIWLSPTREPAEVICHNDFAPHNLIVSHGRLVGAIDFDFAGPGSRLWDLAYLGYRLAPYASDSLEASGLDRERRLRLLLDSYGSDASAERLREVMVEALGALEAHTRARADATGRGDLYEHAEMYRTDAEAILESLRAG